MSVDVEGPQYICPHCGGESVTFLYPDHVLMECDDCGWKDSPEGFDQFDGVVSDGEIEDEYEEACRLTEEERSYVG